MDLVHVQIREAALVVAVVRILVAIEPQMYGEVLAFHFRQERPLSEVVLASSQTLWAEAERMRPHLIIANEVSPELELKEKSSFYWVEVRMVDGLVVNISANGHSDTVEDVSLEDLVAVVDKAEEELAHDEA
jgi:hypothetical protein